jgi:hypothetical protein
MKFLPFFLLWLLCCNTRAQIPNQDMEQWSELPQLLEWQTNSFPVTLPPWEPYIIRKDLDSHSGQYSANFWGNGFIKPIATTTFALGTSRPTHLAFWYKLQFAPCVNEEGHWEKDTVSILIELLNNGAVIDAGYWQSLVNQMEYVEDSIPISHFNSTFDSCRITIIGGSVLGGCGVIAASTEFRIDDLSLVFPKDCIDADLINEEVACPAVYLPVCGCNGVTYGNSCEAKYYNGVVSWTNGPCGDQNAGDCMAAFTFERDSNWVNFYNNSNAANITDYFWDFGDGTSSTEMDVQHLYESSGWYKVCLSISGFDSTGISCEDIFCDSIYISDGCVDSSMICPPWSLCCDAPLEEPVCGCNGVTYMNPCIANSWGGVLHYTEGECISTGVSDAKTIFTHLMPNPAAHILNVRIKVKEPTELTGIVRNVMGAAVLRTSVQCRGSDDCSLEFSVEHLAKGLYTLEIYTDAQLAKVEKWVKQ